MLRRRGLEIVTDLENGIVVHDIAQPRHKELPVRCRGSEVWKVLKRIRCRCERDGMMGENFKPASECVSEGMTSEWSAWRILEQFSNSICCLGYEADEREWTKYLLFLVQN